MSAVYHPECQTVADTIAFHAARSPEVAAVVTVDDAVTYRELDVTSNRLARALYDLGVTTGSRVAVIGFESIAFYELLFAVAKAGAVLVPINWRLSTPEVRHIVRDSGAAVLFADAAADALDAAELGVRVLRYDQPGHRDWISSFDGAAVAAATGRDDAVAQLYTSGTTGLPKGVVLANRSFFAIGDLLARADLDWIDWRTDDISLIGLPGFHVGGLWWAMQGFRSGITNASMPYFSGANALELFARHRITTACMAASMMQLLLAEPGVTRRTFASLRKIVYGGSPISRSLLEECLAVFRCDFAQIYGLTETGNTAVCLPPDQHRPGSGRLLAAGRPYPGVDCRIVAEDGRDLEPGRVGEVWLRTPARMLGYWNLPAATEETLRDGWVVTGDAGYMDAEGYLYIHDRIKDMIITAGENVYPAEVENVLAAHPGVADVAVIGAPDPRWGEAVHAFIQAEPGHRVDQRDLVEFARGRLAAFKMPRAYHEVAVVPRNPSGKILRRELREAFWSDRERQVN